MVEPTMLPFGGVAAIGRWIYMWMKKKKEREKEGMIVYIDKVKGGEDRFIYKNGEFISGRKGPKKGVYDAAPGNLIFSKDYKSKKGTIRFTFDTFFEPVRMKEYPPGLRKRKSLTADDLADFTKERLDFVDVNEVLEMDKEEQKRLFATKIGTAYEYFGLCMIESTGDDSIGFNYEIRRVKRPEKKLNREKTHKRFREQAAEDVGKKIIPKINEAVNGAKEEIKEGIKGMKESVEREIADAKLSAVEGDIETQTIIMEHCENTYATSADTEKLHEDAVAHADEKDAELKVYIDQVGAELKENIEEKESELKENIEKKEKDVKEYVDEKNEELREEMEEKETEVREDLEYLSEKLDEIPDSYAKHEVDQKIYDAKDEMRHEIDKIRDKFDEMAKEIGKYDLASLQAQVAEMLVRAYAPPAVSPVPAVPMEQTPGGTPPQPAEQPEEVSTDRLEKIMEDIRKYRVDAGPVDIHVPESMKDKARRMVAEREAARIVRENPAYYMNGEGSEMRKVWSNVLYEGLKKADADNYKKLKVKDVFEDKEIEELLLEAERGCDA